MQRTDVFYVMNDFFIPVMQPMVPCCDLMEHGTSFFLCIISLHQVKLITLGAKGSFI